MKRSRTGTWLIGHAHASEDLLYAEAECARSGSIETLLPFSYAQAKKGFDFAYQTGMARPLASVLKDPLSSEHFESMLISFRNVGRACDKNNLALKRVSFKEEFVFFDPVRYLLRFAYLPVRSSSSASSDPLHALEWLCEHARFSEAHARQLARTVLDHVRRHPLFSWTGFELFLQEQGILESHVRTSESETAALVKAEAYEGIATGCGYDFVTEALVASSRSVRQPCYNPLVRTKRREHART